MENEEIRMTVRLPMDVVEFLASEARQHFTSKNAQIVKIIRDTVKAKGPAEAATSPSHGSANLSAEKVSEHANI